MSIEQTLGKILVLARVLTSQNVRELIHGR